MRLHGALDVLVWKPNFKGVFSVKLFYFHLANIVVNNEKVH